MPSSRRSFLSRALLLVSAGFASVCKAAEPRGSRRFCVVQTADFSTTEIAKAPNTFAGAAAREIQRMLAAVPPGFPNIVSIEWKNIPDAEKNPDGLFGFYRIVSCSEEAPPEPDRT